MNVKGVCVIVCVCALVITCTDAGIPKCCVKTRKDIPTQLLKMIQRTEVQRNTGACNIEALILHVRNMSKPICAHPKLRVTIAKLKRKMKRHAHRRMH